MTTTDIRIHTVAGIPEVRTGDDLARLVHRAALKGGNPIRPDDLIVIAQKVVSKAEGAIVDLAAVVPTARARELAERVRKDARLVEVILADSRRIVRAVPGVLIVETGHGLICANAGVDRSNVPGAELAIRLPRDPDGSALRLRKTFEELAGGRVAVIVSDSFNRPWREGSVNVAIGVSGFRPLQDSRGQADDHGRPLRVTAVSVADELASAAQLVMGEFGRTPAAIVRGVSVDWSETADSTALRRERARDLFR